MVVQFFAGREVIAVMLIIRLKKGETIDRALKRMKKILDKEGLIKQIRANRYFEKPSEKKRKKAARSRIRSFSRRNSY
jgi:small subunit ribosomal protein S21